ncbi:hypothetical protein [Alkalihalobacillus deserti]|nr:hypothetical protein [Alkalihalobacillus deserti]
MEEYNNYRYQGLMKMTPAQYRGHLLALKVSFIKLSILWGIVNPS